MQPEGRSADHIEHPVGVLIRSLRESRLCPLWKTGPDAPAALPDLHSTRKTFEGRGQPFKPSLVPQGGHAREF